MILDKENRAEHPGVGGILASLGRHRQLTMAQLVDNIRGGRCLLCHGLGGTRGLCPACLADLPWLESACAGCGLPLTGDPGTHPDDRCDACRLTPPPWQRLRALFRYEFPIDRLIAALKYHERLLLADVFGGLLADRADPAALPDLLLPVPVHPHRLRQRGHNQAALLARICARRLGLACDCHSLRRMQDTAMQKLLDREARRANLARAFAWCGPSLAGLHVAVIDDVMTTGATLEALNDILLAAGAASVEGWVIARTLPD